MRVVERIENDGAGLNLTWEVRNGIGCHSYSNPSPEGRARTLEGRAVYFADKIAYLNHDLEDALRAKVLTQDDIPWTIKYALGRTKSQRITALITSLVENSGEDVGMDKATAEAFAQFNSFMYEAVYLNPVAKGEEGKRRRSSRASTATSRSTRRSCPTNTRRSMSGRTPRAPPVITYRACPTATRSRPTNGCSSPRPWEIY